MMRPKKAETVLEVSRKATVSATSGGDKPGPSKAIATTESFIVETTTAGKEKVPPPVIDGSATFECSGQTDGVLAPNTTKDGPMPDTEESRPSDAAVTIENEKARSLIKAWEENEKNKAESKVIKKLSSITYWENSKKANVEAKIKKIEEAYEKEKAYHIGKLKDEVASIHKTAEEKRALVEARRSEEVMKAENTAEMYRSTNQLPRKKIFSFLSS